ncbi:MAG: hypothetical protein H6Q85_1241 [candidate division NC10 bacterium]|nr:hypothetical protein [candidate division NC10 bacterium]
MMIETIGAMTMSVPSDREIVLTRDFEAPRSLVFEMFVRPEHLRRWWGLRGSTLTVCDVDLRPGGAWRYVTRGPKGHENPFTGVYREITPPERLVYTLVYDVEGAREHPGLVTDVFSEKAGGTTLVETMLFPSREARDGLLQSDMKRGAAETFDRLAELLATLTVTRT